MKMPSSKQEFDNISELATYHKSFKIIDRLIVSDSRATIEVKDELQ
jgi:hypothetical protein